MAVGDKIGSIADSVMGATLIGMTVCLTISMRIPWSVQVKKAEEILFYPKNLPY
jgi:hypothetical protein